MLLLCSILGLLLSFSEASLFRFFRNAASELQSVELPLILKTRDGPLQGVVDNTKGIIRYLGIPYGTAQPFAMATPPPAWDGVFFAKEFGPSCWQLRLSEQINEMIAGDLFKSSDRGMADDCLTLNIYSPKEVQGVLPVLVVVHGGSLARGSPSMPLYEASDLASMRKAIVVTVAYRLGPWGFLDNNYGLEDLKLALRWVKENIKEFGGDPANVTAWGHSAGASLVQTLHLSTEDEVLFDKMILMSGSVLALPPRTAQDVDNDLRWLEQRGCDQDCCRDPQRLKTIIENHNMQHIWAPIIGGTGLQQDPGETLRAKAFRSLPTLITWTEDDGSLFIPAGSISHDTKELVGKFLKDELTELAVSLYPLGQRQPTRLWISNVATEVLFRGPALFTARLMAQAGSPVHVFMFGPDYQPTGAYWIDFFSSRKTKFKGVFHGSDVLTLLSSNVNRVYLPPQAKRIEMRKRILDWITDPTTGDRWAERVQIEDDHEKEAEGIERKDADERKGLWDNGCPIDLNKSGIRTDPMDESH